MKMERTDIKEDPLLFWSQHQKTLPTLAKLARFYLAVPASSASIERKFSTAGCVDRIKRSSLKISTMEEILGYREYLEYFLDDRSGTVVV